MKTRAVVLRGISTARPYSETRPLEVEELELGAPREGEVLVRIAAASLCHSDLSVVNGDRVRPLPMALGHEAVGVVQGTGPGVARVRPGDHVVLVYVPSCGFCADYAAGTVTDQHRVTDVLGLQHPGHRCACRGSLRRAAGGCAR
ncbi:alcohol dehydrogenase catalytic domain-containing protein [Streptomyces milbemycinicus]|uniref:2-deoxy-scyllo-inosamine dehydrogenase n=1 Tax=Streptomyces milbemycinicus TaxID=476552 RepID=A0ABW8M4F4_9ACTN